MVTGVEIAGLILAAFPLVLDGLSHWLEGVHKFKRWRRIYRQLKDYETRLQSQRVIYQNTLELLLVGIVHADEDIAAMFAEPRGDVWKKAKYDQLLHRRLDSAYDTFFERLNFMFTILSEIEKKLGMGAGTITWDDYKFSKRKIQELKVVLSENTYKEKLALIDRANAFLQQCTDQSLRLEPSRSKRRFGHTKTDFKSIRKHATSLYNVIVKSNYWKCKCKDHHVASLRLEVRPRTIKDSTTRFRFCLLLCNSINERDAQNMIDWRGIAVEPEPVTLSPGLLDGPGADGNSSVHKSSATAATSKKGVNFVNPLLASPILTPAPAPTDCPLRPVDDICAKIFRLDAAEERVGYLHDKEFAEYRHHVYLTDAKVGSKYRTTSLDRLLDPAEQGPLQNLLSRRQRLNIAAILASSVLQLDRTSWLKSQWNSSDIYFHYSDEDAVLTSRPTFPPPHVACRLSDSNSEPDYAVKPPLARAKQARSETLLTLGLALVELCFGRTLEKMQLPEDVDEKENLTRLNTAIRKLDEVYDESGGHYGDVVRRCLYCSFDVRDASLDAEEFEQDVFDKVVTPLIKDVKVFDGEDE